MTSSQRLRRHNCFASQGAEGLIPSLGSFKVREILCVNLLMTSSPTTVAQDDLKIEDYISRTDACRRPMISTSLCKLHLSRRLSSCSRPIHLVFTMSSFLSSLYSDKLTSLINQPTTRLDQSTLTVTSTKSWAPLRFSVREDAIVLRSL
jgi:hypothetical protein